MELKPNPFRKPEERYQFFVMLTKMHPSTEVAEYVAAQSPASLTAEQQAEKAKLEAKKAKAE